MVHDLTDLSQAGRLRLPIRDTKVRCRSRNIFFAQVFFSDSLFQTEFLMVDEIQL